VIGGTSAVAPLWAGLIAVANQRNGRPAGFIQPAIYAANGQNAFRDTVDGNNGSFDAGKGWDACTGLGSPIAPKIISAIKPSAAGSATRIAASRKKAAVRKGKRK
jgi:kumamolisin